MIPTLARRLGLDHIARGDGLRAASRYGHDVHQHHRLSDAELPFGGTAIAGYVAANWGIAGIQQFRNRKPTASMLAPA
jgi:hypothetical protein